MLKNRFRPKKCKACGSKFTPQKTFQVACSINCAIVDGRRNNEKEAKRKAKEERKQIRADKERIKPRRQVEKEAQAKFNKFIRMRDYYRPCISCGKPNAGKWDAGHYRPSGPNPELRFDEENCHKQCVPCNRHLSGNLVFYRQGLIDRLGQSVVDRLEGPQQAQHRSKEDLQEIKAYYTKRAREVERELGVT